jgi:flagellar basal-body rod modification protein FlgD
MQTNAINGAAGAARTAQAGGTDAMNSEDFFKLLISELKSQDPFNPSQTSDMISQVSQIRNIEVSGQLTKTLTNMAENERNLGAAQLIGKFVQGSVPQEEGEPLPVEGIVTGVTYGSSGKIVLELDNGLTLPTQHLTGVTDVDLTADPATAAPADPALAAANAKSTAARSRNGAAPAWLNVDTSLRI